METENTEQQQNEKEIPQDAGKSNAIKHKRLPEDKFFATYANNVVFQQTAWDLTLVFGKLDPTAGPNTVTQDSSVTLSWGQVKTLLYFIQFNLIDHEIVHGRVLVPKGVITDPNSIDVNNFNEPAKKAVEAIKEMFKRFSEANPEVL